jgi:nicotinate-nucleotide adenylyltransferase
VGHLIIAQAMLDNARLDEVWFVVSPQNPFKKNKSLAHEFDRVDMVERAIEDNDRFKVSDVELHMPRPSYTVHTMAHFREKFPQHLFRLIIGSDNLKGFRRWKNHRVILQDFGLLVYPRPGAEEAADAWKDEPNIQLIDAPLLNISATYVRKRIKSGQSIRYIVHDKTAELIADRRLFL